MVVDDQDSDTNHETPSPELRQEQGTPIVCPSSDDGTGTGTTPRAPHPAVLLCSELRDGSPQPHGRRRAVTATPAPGVVPGCLAP
ncbi:hypothetical protein RGQ21_45690 [Kitasatospora aureofaciens]|nr:hypothetical protein RGQ21_45690 [Kitasatospora aureofaciens]